MRLAGVIFVVTSAGAAWLVGCATPPSASDPEALAEYRDNNDPAEPANRALYAVHDKLDTQIVEPVARGYRETVPQPVRVHFGAFVENLGAPTRLSNDMLQGRPRRAGDTLMRFLINSTLGVGGIFDVATDLGYPKHATDFSITLAMWGTAPGPYVFIPGVGPSEARSVAAYPAGFLLSPLTFLRLTSALQAANLGRSATGTVDDRAGQIDTVAAVKRTALDPYATFRSLYRQHHESEIEATRDDTRATVPVWFDQPAK